MQPTLSIIVPIYNEGKTVAEIMAELAATWADAQFIYVDDGSKDDSLAVLKAHARPNDVVLTKENGGKGSAIRMGLEKATGDYTVIQDADLEYDPTDIRLLLDEAVAHPGAVIFGSRFLRQNPNIYKRFLLGNKAMSLALNVLFFSRITDSYTCYKLLPTPLFRSLHLTARGFELEAEISAKTLLKGVKIREVPISYRPRTIEEGKKIRFSDATKGVRTMLRIRLLGR
jgi:dolichol-phosphate mannosyltransferase